MLRATSVLRLLALVSITLLVPSLASAQDCGSDDDLGSCYGDRLGGRTSAGPPTTPWAFRAGMGFTNDPDDFLLNFELPYRFDRYISAGPMLQVGLEDDRFLVAPTMNLTLTAANLFGDTARFEPNVFGGIGFAVINNDDRGGDTQASGFLANAGFGLDYLLSDRVSVGSRMIFNFLPGKTLDEQFFYSWEIIGVKLNF